MDLLYLSSHQLRRRPQAGTRCILSWEDLAKWLSTPFRGEDKTEAGGYSPALYEGNIRHLDKMIHVGALVFDVDVLGEVDRVAAALSEFSCVVHETYSSTEENARCRVLIQLKDPLNGSSYKFLHQKFRQDELKPRHIHADENATDASRLSYSPVRRLGARYGFRVTGGAPVDGKRVLSRTFCYDIAKPPVSQAGKHPNDNSSSVSLATKQYVESAVASAVYNISQAKEGSRHNTLLRESLSLSRPELNMSLDEVMGCLFDPAVQRMGTGRVHEIRMAIISGYEKARSPSRS